MKQLVKALDKNGDCINYLCRFFPGLNEMRRFCSLFDQVINEINVRLSHQNTKLYAAVSALQP